MTAPSSHPSRRRALLLGAGALAAAAGARPRPAAAAALDCDARERAWFTDRVLLDQNGRRVRFYEDVLRGRSVLIGWIYTSCRDACPLLAARSLAVADVAADNGPAPRIVHITTDPRRDRPETLKAWAARFGDYPDWVLLTGAAADLREVSRRLGQTVDEANPERHTTLLLAGNVSARRWTKLRPDLPPEAVGAMLADVAAAPAVADAAACTG